MSYQKDRDEFVGVIVAELTAPQLHRLVIDSLRDSMAHCSCGRWNTASPAFDRQTDEELREALQGSHSTHVRLSSQAGIELARLILRNAQTIQRIAVKECNEELSEGDKTQRLLAENRISSACKHWGIRPHFSGDPRGACVKLLLPSGRYNSFGGAEDGYCVPTR